MRYALLFFCAAAAVSAAGWLAFPKALYRVEAQPLQFNHKVHVKQSSMACADCHALSEAGEFAGVPPNGNLVRLPAISTFRVENGKLAEAWEIFDSGSFFQQLRA